MPKFSLLVNGRTHSVDLPADTPLLWVLRDELGLVGTKYGCGIGQCGACTIHVNGVAMRSCMLPVSGAAGMPVTTIEGLSEDGAHSLQRAWCDHDVAQCGYCQAGQIMAAAALLKSNPEPMADDITNAMAGNLCRCGTYLRIHAAITTAAKAAKSAEVGA